MQKTVAFWSLPAAVLMALTVMEAHRLLLSPSPRPAYEVLFTSYPYDGEPAYGPRCSHPCLSKHPAPPPQSIPQPFEGFAGVPAAPRPTKRVAVRYPAKAEAAEMGGTAILFIEIGADGDVIEARVAQETPPDFGFGEAAVVAVRRWQFETAVPGTYALRIRFSVD